MRQVSEYLDDYALEAFEERAAIREFDGLQSRHEAERYAMSEIGAMVDSEKAQK